MRSASRQVPAMLRLGVFRTPTCHAHIEEPVDRRSVAALADIPLTIRQPIRRMASTSFSARPKVCCLWMACDTGAPRVAGLERVKLAWNTPSGVPNSGNKRLASRAAMPGVNLSGRHEREASGSPPSRGYGYSNLHVQYLKNRKTGLPCSLGTEARSLVWLICFAQARKNATG
jgi:hypothetical protein